MLGGEEEALVAFLMLSNHTWKGTDVRGGKLLSIPSENYGRMNPLLTKKRQIIGSSAFHLVPSLLSLSSSSSIKSSS